ncbi:MAG: PKD domain-containing protein, partial [Rhodanobacteraceae bacterium]
MYGDYHVVVENSNGCQAASNTVHVIENCGDCPDPNPTLISSDSTLTGCGTAEVDIHYNPNGLTINSETWEFPDGALNTDYNLGTNAWASASFEEAGIYAFNYRVSYDSCEVIFIQSVYVPYIGDMKYEVSCGSGSLYDITLFDHSNIYPSEVGHIHHSYAYKEVGGSWVLFATNVPDLSADTQVPAGDYQLREIIWSDATTAAPPCTTLVHLILPDKPNADFDIEAPYIPACINDVVIHLDNQSTPSTGLEYVWNFGDLSTNYQPIPDKVYAFSGPKLITLTATNNIGCTDSTQNTIDIEDNELWDGTTKPVLSISPAPPVCIGNPITLSYFNFGFTIPTGYNWYQGSTPLTPVVSSGSFGVTEPGEYWVMGSDTYGCLVPSSSAVVNFTQVPIPTILGNHEYCDSVDFSLTSSLNVEPGMALDWERTPGGYMGNTSTIYQNLLAGTYEYTLTVTQGGCSATSAPFTVTISDPVDTPAVAFTITNCQPYTVELSATNTESGIYNWSNGGTGATVNANSGGPYKVTFTSTSGCTSETFIDVPKAPSEYLWIFPTGCFCADDLAWEGHSCSGKYNGTFI